jgi:hypothetical protein
MASTWKNAEVLADAVSTTWSLRRQRARGVACRQRQACGAQAGRIFEVSGCRGTAQKKLGSRRQNVKAANSLGPYHEAHTDPRTR